MKGLWTGLSTLILLCSSGSVAAQTRQSRSIEPDIALSKNHTYYIAADEIKWNYAPRGRNLTGSPVAETEENDEANLGHPASKVFLKAVYREYTDGTFKTLKPRPEEWEHLGILGPLIRAEVGDIIHVVFLNNTKIFCSMHPHGLQYSKDSEGALYNDGTSGPDKADDLIPPGKSYTYTWKVPKRAGPAVADPSSVVWMYHSHFVEPKDMNTGLLGPIVISPRGTTRPDGRPKDVDREFVIALAVFDETASAYFGSNATIRVKYPLSLKVTDPALRKLYLMYSINGLVEGNLPMLTMKRGERVRWYLLSNSNEDDVHAAHWHGQTVLFNNMRSDTVPLAPMAMVIADMLPDAVGTWLFHCHVNDHFEGGMQALFKVLP